MNDTISMLTIDQGMVSVMPPPGVPVLQDNNKNWTANVHRNRLVRIVDGSGTGQQRVILSNSPNLLTLNQAWVVLPDHKSSYVIVGTDIAQVIRDVVGGGADISAANPLQVFDPKVWGSVSGLVMGGEVTDIPGADQFTIPALADLGEGKFADATAPYYAFVSRDADGAGAAPQGEVQQVTGYDSAAGTFTTNAFTVPVDVGDEVLIIHPKLANMVTGQSGTQATSNVLATIGSAIEGTGPFSVSGFISLHNMQAGDAFLVLEEIRDQDGVTYREYARNIYSDVQTSPMIHFTEKVCTGMRVQIQRTAGVDRDVTYQFFRKG